MDLIEEEDQEIFGDGDNLELSNEGMQPNQENDNEDDEKEDEKKPVKAKRIIRHPRAKLNAELLKGPKGLGNLEKCFERVQFRGKGHEEQDLNVMLKTYEYWCHRLFPKFPFKDCIAKIETLGSKGPIQTHLKKVRSGMIDETETDVLPDFKSDDENDEPSQSNPVQTTSQALIDDIPVELTEEQLETIRRNREKAEKLRQERLRKIQEKASVNLPEKNVMSETTTATTSRLSTESNRDNGLYIQSHESNRKEIVENSHANNVENDDELISIRKHSKKTFDNDEEELLETVESSHTNNEEIESDDELISIRKRSKKPFDNDEEEETITKMVEEKQDEVDIMQKDKSMNLSTSGNDAVEKMNVDE